MSDTFAARFLATFNGRQPGNEGPSTPNIPSWNTVEVRGRYLHFTGEPVTGRVIFTIIPRLQAPTDNIIIPRGDSRAINLEPDGSFTVRLPATDDEDIFPGAFQYEVREDFEGVSGETYYLDVPLAYYIDGVELSDLIDPPTPAPGQVSQVPSMAQFAELRDLVRQVVGTSVFMVNGKTGIILLNASDVGADQAGAADAVRTELIAKLATQGLPTGGSGGTILSKNSGNDFDAHWASVLALAGEPGADTLSIQTGAPNRRGVRIKGVNNQAASPLQVVNNIDAILMEVDPQGRIKGKNVEATPVTVNDPALTLQGLVGQVARLLLLKNSGGVTTLSANADGDLDARTITAAATMQAARFGTLSGNMRAEANGDIITNGRFIGSTIDALTNAINVWGLHYEAIDVNTPLSAVPNGAHMTSANLYGGYGPLVTLKIGGGDGTAFQVWVNYGVGDSNHPLWCDLAFRTSIGGNWRSWIRR